MVQPMPILQDGNSRLMAEQRKDPDQEQRHARANSKGATSQTKSGLVLPRESVVVQLREPLSSLDLSLLSGGQTLSGKMLRHPEVYSIATPERNYHAATEREAPGGTGAPRPRRRWG